MTKKWRIKKESLNETGHFFRGRGVGTEEEQPTEELPQGAVVVPEPNPMLPDFFGGARNKLQTAIDSGLVMPGQPEMNRMNQESMPPAEVPQQIQAGMQQVVQAPQSPLANNYMQQAELQGKIASQQTKLYDDTLEQQKNLEVDLQNRNKRYQTERDAIAKQLDETPVDANRYYNSHTSGGKVAVAIGLLLGGIGGGLDRSGRNSALEYLNAQIGRDIDAQKEGRKTKENLLSQLEKQYGNETDAVKVLQSALQVRLANQINRTALASGGAKAKLDAEQITAKLFQDANAPLAAAALKGQTYDLIKRGATPEQLGRMGVDDKVLSRVIPGIGLAKTEEDKKELLKVAEAGRGTTTILDQMEALGPTALIPNSDANQAAQGLATQMIFNIKNLESLGVLSESDLGLAEGSFSDPRKLVTQLFGRGQSAVTRQRVIDKLRDATSGRVEVSSLPEKAAPKQNSNRKYFKQD